VTAECIHGKVQGVASDGFSNLDDLFRSAMFKAALNQEVTEAIYIKDMPEQLWLQQCRTFALCANLELLLKEDRCLLIIVAKQILSTMYFQLQLTVRSRRRR